MKKVVVVVKSVDGLGHDFDLELEFNTKRDFLTVHNNPEGYLIVNDVREDKKTQNRITDTVAVFNHNGWLYWIEKQ